jgi:hypothetical protein
VSDEPIKHGLNELVALCIEYEVRKPGMAAAIAKIIDDCTDNRDVQIALLTRDLAAAREELAAANATVEKCKAAGFIDEQGNVVATSTHWLATDDQYETEQSVEDVAQFLYDNILAKNGQVFEATPVVMLSPQLFVMQVDADENVSCSPANTEQIAAFKKKRAAEQRKRDVEFAAMNANVQPVQAIPFPTAAEAAREGKETT